MKCAAVRNVFVMAFVSLYGLIAHAEVLFAETATLTAARESARVYLQEVALNAPSQPYAVQLPGTAPSGVLHVSPDGKFILAGAVDRNDADLSTVTCIAAARPERSAMAWQSIPVRGGMFAGMVTHGPDLLRAVVVSGIEDGPLHGLGRIETRDCRTAPSVVMEAASAEWLLPGAPAAAAAFPNAGRVAVLCRTPTGGTVLHVRDVLRGRVEQERVPIASSREEVEPVGLGLVHDGRYLVAVLNESAATSDAAEGRCWAITLDATTATPIGDPIALPGAFTAGATITSSADGACWIATRSPSAGFAYACCLQPGDHGYAKALTFSFTGVSQDVLIAPGSAGASVAVGVERRLEVWPEGKPGGPTMSYSAPIRALLWRDGTIIAGEANRLHGVRAEDCGERWMLALQTGQVTALLLLPTPPGATTDADNDRLVDSVDPEPNTPSPRLDLPTGIVLHAEAAGREVRSVRIDAPYATDAAWRVQFDATRAPWLRVFPRQGRVPGWFVIGVDPSLDGKRERTASLEVTLTGTKADVPAASSPQRIDICVKPRSAASHEVLWLLSETNQRALAALAGDLSGPPFYWSQVVPADRADEPLEAYAAIVLDSAAIGKGIVSRQVLLDYVANGGGLLVLASGGHSGVDIGQRWLAPIGIGIDSNAVVNGAMAVSASHPITQHWTKFDVRNAARLRLDEASTVVATIGETPALIVRSFGRGRIAVLASPAPLTADALAKRENHMFAADLFDWLSRAVIETADLDGDGLPDSLEDRNTNGLVDPGETSELDPDSDGDGIPDGMEDLNSNGRVDEGETSPLNPDTDGDGDLDGADYDPVPPLNAPVAASLVPSTGPAEGGTRVQIDGRNLGADAAVWFGARAAKAVDVAGATGLVVEAPPSEAENGGAVDVRVENAGKQGTVLPGGFVYGPRSRVSLALDTLASANAQYQGSVTLSVGAPDGVRAGRVSVRLDTNPPGQLEWFDLHPASEAALAGRRTIQRGLNEGEIVFDVTPPTRTPDGVALAVVQCRARQPLSAGASVTVVIENVEVDAPNGEPLAVDVAPAALHWLGQQEASVAVPEGP